MLFKWETGRQGTGYKKLTLLMSKRWMRDAYVIFYPKGSYIPTHTDPAPQGYVHKRVNIIFRNGFGGRFICSKTIRSFNFFDFDRIGLSYQSFFPSEAEHSVSEVTEGYRIAFSFGRLIKVKDLSRV